ncbi:MAG TPA: MAPEG family protein [Rhizomicrobium sp.]|nr:MAPEG family protein [Rhizomicrobium sp.]
MSDIFIFAPMAALIALTFVVLTLIPVKRFRAGFAGEITGEDFRFGESARVPGHVSIPNRNYMNLLELPMLFYVLCLSLYVTHNVTGLEYGLAWAYVGLRAAHSAVHLTLNHIFTRLTIFAMSNVVLAVAWALFFLKIFSR